MISDLSTNWAQSIDDTRRAMANSLFEYLVYDLDTWRIVDSHEVWVEQVMQLKVTLQENEKKCPRFLTGAKGY